MMEPEENGDECEKLMMTYPLVVPSSPSSRSVTTITTTCTTSTDDSTSSFEEDRIYIDVHKVILRPVPLCPNLEDVVIDNIDTNESSSMLTKPNENNQTHHNTKRKDKSSGSVKDGERSPLISKSLAAMDATALVLSGSTVAIAAAGGAACVAFPLVAAAAAAGAAYVAATGTARKGGNKGNKHGNNKGSSSVDVSKKRVKRKRRHHRSSKGQKRHQKVHTMDDILKQAVANGKNWLQHHSRAQ